MNRLLQNRHCEIENLKKALQDCHKLLSSSEDDVDTTIKSKEMLLKTFQELQNKHQVKCEELETLRRELQHTKLKLRSLEGGKCINIHFLGRSIKGKF